jgi:hypothetical protein
MSATLAGYNKAAGRTGIIEMASIHPITEE